jgi:hypothetical protein
VEGASSAVQAGGNVDLLREPVHKDDHVGVPMLALTWGARLGSPWRPPPSVQRGPRGIGVSKHLLVPGLVDLAVVAGAYIVHDIRDHAGPVEVLPEIAEGLGTAPMTSCGESWASISGRLRQGPSGCRACHPRKRRPVLLIEFGEVLLLGVPGVFGVGLAYTLRKSAPRVMWSRERMALRRAKARGCLISTGRIGRPSLAARTALESSSLSASPLVRVR